MSVSTLVNAVRRQKITPAKAEALAKALGVSCSLLFDEDRNATPLSAKTVRAYHCLISRVIRQAMKDQLVTVNVARYAIVPKCERKRADTFQPEQCAKILEALSHEGLQHQTMGVIFLATGCRRSELAGLTWEKIDFENGTIIIDQGLTKSKKNKLVLGPTKEADVRVLSLPDFVIEMLRQLREERECNVSDKDFIFLNTKGVVYSPDCITQWFSDFSNRYGLPHINPHAFTHTCASILIANGTDIQTVSDILGHANSSITEIIYTHQIKQNRAKAQKHLTGVLFDDVHCFDQYKTSSQDTDDK